MLSDKVKTTPNKLNAALNVDKFSVNPQDAFANLSLPSAMTNQLNESLQKMKKEAGKMAEELKVHEEMKKKDNKIIEHLRKAKNRGNLLFKKI